MSIAVKFNKQKAQYYLECLKNGRAIAPGDGNWTGNEMLAVAGACFFGAMSQGTQSFWLKELPDTMHAEHREAAEEKFDHDLHAAVAFYGQLTKLVEYESFDEQFAPEVMALVSQQGDTELSVFPVKGVKGQPDKI